MPNPLVSVILPVFNGAATLESALSSITAQTLPDWELIVVNDGSTDNTGNLLKSASQADSRVRILEIPHAGVVAAHNAGLAAARAPFVARMDADDQCHPERLALQVDYLQKHPDIGLVGCLVEYGGDRTRQAGYARHVDWVNSVASPEDVSLNRFVEMPMANPTLMFRRSTISEQGSYQEGPFPEDYELVLRWLDAGVRLAKVPQVLLRWNDPPTRLTRNDPRYDTETFYQLKAGYLARWLKAHVPSNRRLLAWGAGRLTRRRIELLEDRGVMVDGFIDIDPRKTGRRRDGREVIMPDQVPPADQCFVLGYVAKRDARELIRHHLHNRGYMEGRDFLMAA